MLEPVSEHAPCGRVEPEHRAGAILGVTHKYAVAVPGHFDATAVRGAIAGLTPVQSVHRSPAFRIRSWVCVHGSASARRPSNTRAARAIWSGSVYTPPLTIESV